MHKRDIENRNDIVVLITYFYQLAFEDQRLGEIFKQITPIDLEKHIPLVADFWEGILFDTFTYKGNVTEKHFETNRKTPLSKQDFDLWFFYWEKAVNHLFEGELAQKIKDRASSIANIMSYKMDYVNKKN